MSKVSRRTVRAAIADSERLFEIVDVGDQRYDIASLVVPVRPETGAIPMILRARQLSQDVDGAAVRGWIAALSSRRRRS